MRQNTGTKTTSQFKRTMHKFNGIGPKQIVLLISRSKLQWLTYLAVGILSEIWLVIVITAI